MKTEREIALRLETYRKNLAIAKKNTGAHTYIKSAINELLWVLEKGAR